MSSSSSRAELEARLKAKVRSVPDFPKAGILFRDITPLLADAAARRAALELHLDCVADLRASLEPSLDVVIGIESRGFLFGPLLAERLELGFAPARKPGKLPAETIEERYALEYGESALQLHRDAIAPGAGVIIVDDLLATGGTAAATVRLVERLGGRVLACVFLIELSALGGRQRLDGMRVEALLRY